MMRSLYSGVSGLKTHQTRMDVIGNNIANVNTTAYKTKSINFSDMLYQTTQAATAPNAANGTAGTNARQIGLGVKTGAINTSITTEGATQSTGNPFDLKLTGEAFFVVSDGTNQYFTRDGSFNVDAAGYLCMGSTGYIVQGWTNTDAETGAIIQDSVQPIQIMSEANSTYPAAYTTSATISGILDKYDDNLDTENGRILNVQTLDNKGYEYNIKFGIKPVTSTTTSNKEVLNTERLYTLPASFKRVDNSELTFYKTGLNTDPGTNTAPNSLGDEITASGMPAGLMEAIEEVARMTVDELAAKNQTLGANTITRDESHVDGTNDYTYILIDDNFLAAYGLDGESGLGDYASIKGTYIAVNFSGDTAYEAFTGADGTGTSLGIIDIEDNVLTALYAGVPTGIGADPDSTVNLNANTENGLLVTEKTYTDGTDAKYTLAYTDAARTEIEDTALTYSDITKLLAACNSTVQSQITSVEETTTESKVDGQFTIEILGMTDSDGSDVDITALDKTPINIVYDTSNGKFSYVGSEGNTAFTVNLSALGTHFSDVSFDMSNTTNVDNGGKSTVSALRDDGRKVGTLTGVSIGTDGVITANYSNGMSKAIAQIAVATFANAMGLQNEGDNLYSATANSGEFDGVGVDIKASGTGYMTTGVLEMSNVDLSQEFTDMITTQRGFQANSRIITTSDTLLEELVNLKR